MGLIVSIYKESNDSYECTNGGASSQSIKGFCITNLDGPFEPSTEYPAAEIKERVISGETYRSVVPTMQYFRNVPVESKAVSVMFGGNFCYTSDSRFREVSDYPLPIHDRLER